MSLALIEAQELRTFDDERPAPRHTQLTRWREMLTHSAHVIGMRTNEEIVAELKDAFLTVYDYRLGSDRTIAVDDYIYALKRYERAHASLLVRGFEAAAIAVITARALLERESARV